jgi:hypothetical protein
VKVTARSRPERLGCPHCGEPVFTDIRLTRVPAAGLNAQESFEYTRAATFNVEKVYCAAGHNWSSFNELVERFPDPEPERPWP